MTKEERELLIDRLFYAEVDKYCNLVDINPMILKDAADEIERLADRVNTLEHIINLDMYEVTKTALVQAQDENERLAKKLAEAEAALKNTLLHYNVSDVHFLDSDDLAR